MAKRAKPDVFRLLIRLAKEGHVFLEPPATEAAIRKLQSAAKKELRSLVPAAYVALLRIANGLQINGAFFKSAEHLVAENLDLDHPEIIVLGDEGSLAWHAFDKRDERFHTINFGFPDERFASYDSLEELLIGVMKEQQVLTMKFDIQPGIGALPIKLGMRRKEVRELIGAPESTFSIFDGTGKAENYADGFCLGYNKQGKINHIGFSPGDAELTLNGQPLWTAKKRKKQQPDPNPALLALDPEPFECVGFWFFEQLGVTTTGYHDDDESQRAITVYPRGSKAELLADAERADTSKYQKPAKKRTATVTKKAVRKKTRAKRR